MKTRKFLGLLLMVAMLFNFTTPAATMVSAAQTIEEVLAQINLGLINNGGNDKVYGDLYLPTTLPGVEGLTISWVSDNTATLEVVGEVGKVKKLYVNQTTPVKLTATVNYGGTIQSKDIVVTLTYNDCPIPPADAELLFHENFNGKTLDTVSGVLEKGGDGGGSLVLEEDRLKLTRTATTQGGKDDISYYFKNKTDSIVGDSVVFQFDIAMENAKPVIFRTNSVTKNIASNITLYPLGNNFISAWINATKANTYESSHLKTASTTYTVRHNYTNKTYSLWVGGEKLIDEASFRDTNANGLSHLYLYLENQYTNTIYLDNIKVYNEQTNFSNGLSIATINEGNSSSTIKKDLYLPSTLPWDSNTTLAWTSDNANLVVDGMVGRVTLYEDKQSQVTLTASSMNNGVEICKAFNLVLPYDDVPKAPSDANLLFSENFDGKTKATVNGVLTQTGGGGGTLDVVDGKLKLQRTSTSTSSTNGANQDGFEYYFKSDKANISGDRVVVEFELEREFAKDGTFIRTRTGGYSPAHIILSTNAVKAYNSGTATSVKSNYTKTAKTKYIIEHNLTKKVFSMWIDGEKVATDFGFRNITGVFSFLNVVLENANTNTLYFDNIKVYNYVPNMKEQVDTNINTIKGAGVGAIQSEKDGNNTLRFGYNASYNCVTTFSSEKGLVNSDGSINYPEFVTNDVVTVTVSKGEYSNTASYPVTIASKFSFGAITFENEYPVLGENVVFMEGFSRTNETYDAIVVVAAYENNKLKAVHIEPNTIMPKSDDPEQNILFGFVELNATENITLKAFVLDNIGNIKPYR